MTPFIEGNNANRVYYNTFDELYRQHASDGSIEHNYSIWTVNPLTHKDEVYAIVTSRDAATGITVDGKDLALDPSAYRKLTSDEVEVETPMRLIFYMKLGSIETYNKFFVRFQSPGSKSSRQLMHDFDSHILDVHSFDEEGNLLTGQRKQVLKLTKAQWREQTCVLPVT
ncbi:MAG: hypothetical protein H8D23_11045 [Candidatus Brocadiales bacterium]|nr:hypothetical protein [Candidatus Brocadiales bacterium]